MANIWISNKLIEFWSNNCLDVEFFTSSQSIEFFIVHLCSVSF